MDSDPEVVHVLVRAISCVGVDRKDPGGSYLTLGFIKDEQTKYTCQQNIVLAITEKLWRLQNAQAVVQIGDIMMSHVPDGMGLIANVVDDVKVEGWIGKALRDFYAAAVCAQALKYVENVKGVKQEKLPKPFRRRCHDVFTSAHLVSAQLKSHFRYFGRFVYKLWKMGMGLH